MVESSTLIIGRYTDNCFKVVAKTFADGGGDKNAKTKIDKLLHDLWGISRKRERLDFAENLRNTINYRLRD